jgi:ribosomal protein S27E
MKKCSNCGRNDAIKWNPWNKVIQCHNCGHIVK